MSDDKQRLIVMVGLPASGKSTTAKDIIGDRDDIVYLSSDLLRLELFGNIDDQSHNGEVFNEMAKRTKEVLKNGKHVVYDATNINRKRRRGLLQQIPKNVEKIAIYMATPYRTVLERNQNRERIVPEKVIERMYKNMQIPIKSEGWDKIIFEYDDETLEDDLPKQFTDAIRAGVLLGREGYELMGFLTTYFDEFSQIYEMPQDSAYHSFSVSRHIYHVYRYVLENYEGEDKELMLWTALLHDIGKAECKSFVNRKGEETRYANFIGHENVGWQKSVPFLKRMNFNDEFIYTVATLIQFHMYLLNENNNREKLRAYVGNDLYEKLEFLRKADALAH